mgnify:CR=1 FL=1
MTVTVAMHEASYAHIGPRLDALGLDIAVITFDSDGMYRVDGKATPPAEVSVDYFWLSSHIAKAGATKAAFKLVLDTKSIDVLQTFNAGLDAPVYRQASGKGVRICNSSAQSVAIAEYTMAQVLSVYHPIEQQRALQAAGTWQQTPFRELSRATWLIVGLGAIGHDVAVRAKAFGSTVLAVRRAPAADPAIDEAGTLDALAEFLPRADIILLSCPLTETTQGLADKAFFAAAKPGAMLVNIGRGGLIDDTAMIASLDENRLATAVLDVFDQEPLPADNPLWTHPKVRITSHTSFNGNGVQDRWDALFLDNLPRYLKGEPLLREVAPADI